jgi:hypothetical protein
VSTSPPERPRCLVEAGWGLGDVVEAAPTCRALWLLGFDVDFLVNRDDGGRVAALFEGLPTYGRVRTARRQVDVSAYDAGIGCFGPSQAVRRLPAGFWLGVTLRDVTRLGLAGANFEPARLLGYEDEAPGHLLRLDEEGADVPAGSVVVHAGCDPRSTYKRWPHWEAVCDRLRRRGAHVVVVGTEDDRSPSGWERRHDPRFDLSLPRLAALLRNARAYLGTDSGVTHLAGAVGARGLALFGPTDPRLYAPASRAMRVLDVPPRPGEGRQPVSTTFPSIERLDLETVWAEVTRLLDDPPVATERPVPERRASPVASRPPALPTLAEIRAAPATLEGMDEILRRTAVAAILGWLARRGDAAEAAPWRREVARVAGLAHLRAAAVRRSAGTWVGHRHERLHLRQALLAGYRVRAGVRRLLHALTPASRRRDEPDPLRH